jgi:hypothetical protein
VPFKTLIIQSYHYTNHMWNQASDTHEKTLAALHFFSSASLSLFFEGHLLSPNYRQVRWMRVSGLCSKISPDLTMMGNAKIASYVRPPD